MSTADRSAAVSLAMRTADIDVVSDALLRQLAGDLAAAGQLLDQHLQRDVRATDAAFSDLRARLGQIIADAAALAALDGWA